MHRGRLLGGVRVAVVTLGVATVAEALRRYSSFTPDPRGDGLVAGFAAIITLVFVTAGLAIVSAGLAVPAPGRVGRVLDYGPGGRRAAAVGAAGMVLGSFLFWVNSVDGVTGVDGAMTALSAVAYAGGFVLLASLLVGRLLRAGLTVAARGVRHLGRDAR